MSSTTKPDGSTLVSDEERRLLQALVGRGWLSAEDIKEFLAGRPSAEPGARELLTQLVKLNYLTPNQAKRAHKDLETLLHQQIPGYELLEKLGQGAMGRVYKARQISMNRLVAIKILNKELSANQDYIARFLREARTAAKLSCNNIVQAIDVGSVGPVHYFVMEYVEGTTIKGELESGKIYQESEAVEIAVQIAQALDHAHSRGLVHRDVKPANIILAPEGVAKLADMGLAYQVHDQEFIKAEKGMTVGTPYYIAPELIGGELEADIRADVYSLGATLYHMLVGRPPFSHPTVHQLLRAHLFEELIPPDHLNARLSAGIGEVVEFMMVKDRAHRYQTPAEVIQDLECLLRGEPPKLARRQTHYDTLAALAHGAVENPMPQVTVTQQAADPQLVTWLTILAVLLGLSILLNLILLS